jgi:hypothetical protein
MDGAIPAGVGMLALAGEEVTTLVGVWVASTIRSGVILIMHTDLIIGVVTTARGLVAAIMRLDIETEMLII